MEEDLLEQIKQLKAQLEEQEKKQKDEQNARIVVHGTVNIAQKDVTNLLSYNEFHFPSDPSLPVVNLQRSMQDALAHPELQDAHIVPDDEVTKALFSASAFVLWKRLQEAELIDMAYQPTASTNWMQRSIIANVMSEILFSCNRWQPFEQLWNHRDLKKNYNAAFEKNESAGEYKAKIRQILQANNNAGTPCFPTKV